MNTPTTHSQLLYTNYAPFTAGPTMASEVQGHFTKLMTNKICLHQGNTNTHPKL